MELKTAAELGIDIETAEIQSATAAWGYLRTVEYNRRSFSTEDSFRATTPEMPGCEEFGKTPEEALDKLEARLILWLLDTARTGDRLPAPMTETLGVLLRDVLQERRSQERQWGEQDHGQEIWLTVLSEEVGEVARAILQVRAAKNPKELEHWKRQLRRELVQVAAVAVQAIEAWDREDYQPKGLQHE